MAPRQRKRAKRRRRRDNSRPGEVGRGPFPKFRFEAGSYGGGGRFMPSIACLKQTIPQRQDYHFVLVRPDQVYAQEEGAVLQAERDLEGAFSARQRAGSDPAVAEHLRSKGYLSVTNFRVVAD